MIKTAAYVLRPDVSRLGDDDWDVLLDAELRDQGLPRGQWRAGELRGRVTRPIDRLDVLANPQHLPLVSGACFDALVGGTTGAAEAIPLQLRTTSGGAAPGLFVLVYVPAYSPVFDPGASEWSESDLFPGEVDRIDRLVLQHGALPPVFRLKEEPGVLFVSAEARARAEAAGAAAGASWTPVPASEAT